MAFNNDTLEKMPLISIFVTKTSIFVVQNCWYFWKQPCFAIKIADIANKHLSRHHHNFPFPSSDGPSTHLSSALK